MGPSFASVTSPVGKWALIAFALPMRLARAAQCFVFVANVARIQLCPFGLPPQFRSVVENEVLNESEPNELTYKPQQHRLKNVTES